jgi:predicted nucleic acid-binding protein
MAFVLDASVTVSWFLPDEEHRDALDAWRRSADEEVHVPLHWWFEVRNTMLMGERRNRISEHMTTHSLNRLSLLPITVEPRPDEADVLDVARRWRLTFYDATYLELARRKALPLATLDRELIVAARSEGVELVGHDSKTG